MRACIVLCAVILYLLSFNFYLWNIPNPGILREYKFLWYTYTTGGILAFYTIDGWRGYETFEHDIASKFLLITILTNFGLIALTHHGVISQPFVQIGLFNAVWMIAALMIFFSCLKNGVFRK